MSGRAGCALAPAGLGFRVGSNSAQSSSSSSGGGAADADVEARGGTDASSVCSRVLCAEITTTKGKSSISAQTSCTARDAHVKRACGGARGSVGGLLVGRELARARALALFAVLAPLAGVVRPAVAERDPARAAGAADAVELERGDVRVGDELGDALALVAQRRALAAAHGVVVAHTARRRVLGQRLGRELDELAVDEHRLADLERRRDGLGLPLDRCDGSRRL